MEREREREREREEGMCAVLLGFGLLDGDATGVGDSRRGVRSWNDGSFLGLSLAWRIMVENGTPLCFFLVKLFFKIF
jgi:hypothetical protein